MTIERRSDAEAMDGVTVDAFIGEAVKVRQPVQGYRAGLDAVMLAAAVCAEPGDRVVEFGTGAGTAAMCLLWRIPGITVTGIEAQPHYAALARANARTNGFGERFQCIEAVLPQVQGQLAANGYDHVFFNPPYGERGKGTISPHPATARATAMCENTIGDWIGAALKLLKPGGRLTIIHRAGVLNEILAGLQDRAGAIEIIPLWTRAGASASRVIVRSRKGYRTPLTLHAGLCLHSGSGGFTAEADAVLRHGQGLFVSL